MKHIPVVKLDITSFSKEGHGIGCVAYPEGKQSIVEVPFTLPGDEVQASLFRRHKGVYQSRLEQIEKPAENRVAPRCIHFGECGGCRWQQMPYEDQLRQKELNIQHHFAPYLHPQLTIHPILPCLPPWLYRNKMEFSFSSDRAQNRYLGLFLYSGRGRVFNLTECHLMQPWVVEAAKTIRLWWEESNIEAYHPTKNTGSLRTVTLREGRRTGDRMIMLTVSGNPEFALHKEQLKRFVTLLREAVEPKDPQEHLSIFLRIQQIAKGRPTQFYEMLLYGPDHIREELFIQTEEHLSAERFKFRISPTAFFQPNTEQAERLYSRALQMGKIPPNSLVYDLYCGTGTLGICAAKQAREVIGIELSPESVLDARENIKLNNLENITILAGDVGHVLAQLQLEGKPRPDVVLIDPPRAGLEPKAIQHILALKAPKLIYISCNPATQAANMESLLKEGYQLQAIQPVDQFPQTLHIENIAILTLK